MHLHAHSLRGWTAVQSHAAVGRPHARHHVLDSRSTTLSRAKFLLRSARWEEIAGEKHLQARHRTAPSTVSSLRHWKSGGSYPSIPASADGGDGAVDQKTDRPSTSSGSSYKRRETPLQPMGATLQGHASQMAGGDAEAYSDGPLLVPRSAPRSTDPNAAARRHPARAPSRPSSANHSPQPARYGGSYSDDGASNNRSGRPQWQDSARRDDGDGHFGGHAGEVGDSSSWQQQQQQQHGGSGAPRRALSYSQRMALLRKPALTAVDKTAVGPEERARIYRALRHPTRGSAFRAAPSSSSLEGPRQASSRAPPLARLPLPLRVYCYGIDDVRLYRALEGAGALGRVLVVAGVDEADAVLATRTKRTGRALSLTEVANAARNAGKPFLELLAVSPVRVMEAVEALTGLPVPEHLLQRQPQLVTYLPPLERDSSGSAAALSLLSEGRSLPEYLMTREGAELPAAILVEMDRTDMYDSRESHLPANPQEREAVRQRPLTRPYMDRSRIERRRLALEQQRRKAEAEGAVPW